MHPSIQIFFLLSLDTPPYGQHSGQSGGRGICFVPPIMVSVLRSKMYRTIRANGGGAPVLRF